MASNAENVFIWWRHHDSRLISPLKLVTRLMITSNFNVHVLIYPSLFSVAHTHLQKYGSVTQRLMIVFRGCEKYCLSWWRHQMETFPAWLALCGNGEFPAQRPVTRPLFHLICAWINGWVNNPEAGDPRRHRAQYDATVMIKRKRPYAATDTSLILSQGFPILN